MKNNNEFISSFDKVPRRRLSCIDTGLASQFLHELVDDTQNSALLPMHHRFIDVSSCSMHQKNNCIHFLFFIFVPNYSCCLTNCGIFSFFSMSIGT
jgi:hypothetical protein